MNKCVVNLATQGRENYLSGQARLLASLRKYESETQQLFYTSSYPPGCPPHSDVPYAFKYYVMQEAFDRGADLVFWLDASVVILKPLTFLWKTIEERGILVFNNPGTPELWFTTKACLDHIGCGYDEAEKICQVSGGIVGYNRHHDTAMIIFNQMKKWAKEATPFRGGPSTGVPGKKFIAHRHDQSCLSFLTHKYGVQRAAYGDLLAYSKDVKPSTVLELRGM